MTIKVGMFTTTTIVEIIADTTVVLAMNVANVKAIVGSFLLLLD
jgi:hypothetical protein